MNSEMEISEHRTIWVDVVKGFAIILVMLGHVDWDTSNPICIWIYSFHMPIFFILSGILSYLKQSALKKTTLEFLKNKIEKLLYPYLTFSILAIIYTWVRNGNVGDALKETFSTLGCSALWFLPCLFVSEICFFLLRKSKIPDIISIVFLLGLVYLGCRVTFSYDYYFKRIIIGTIFIFIGYYSALYFTKAGGVLHRKICLLIGIVLFGVNFFVSQLNSMPDLHYAIINNYFLYFYTAIIGSFGTILICMNLELPKRIVWLLSYLGKYSLIVLGTHLSLGITQAVVSILHKIISFGVELINSKVFSLILANRYIFDFAALTVLVIVESLIILAVKKYGQFLVSIPHRLNSKLSKNDTN